MPETRFPGVSASEEGLHIDRRGLRLDEGLEAVTNDRQSYALTHPITGQPT